MKKLFLTTAILFSVATNAMAMNCTGYSASRGGTFLINGIQPGGRQSEVILKADGKVLDLSKEETMTEEEKLKSVVIRFGTLQGEPNKPMVVFYQYQKMEGFSFLGKAPLLSVQGYGTELHLNYLEKDLALNCN